MTTPEILPCPFCGGHASLVSPAMGRPYVCCDDNFCTGPKPSADQALAAWNARAPLSPAVLAELPEVRALADDLASCIAMIQHAIGQGKDTFIEPDTKRKLSDARTRLETFRAAAIREGRNG